MPYPNEYSCRLRNPDDFQKDSYVRTKRKSKTYNKTYSVIQGRLKGEDTLTDQAYRYPKKTWSASEARSHCKAHKGSYEAIAEILKMNALIVEAAHRHNSTVAESEPSWGSVDKTALPRSAHAEQGEAGKRSTWGYPHHWIKGGTKKDNDGVWIDGEMYLHKGGLDTAWRAAHGARSGKKASSSVISHLRAHRRALGLSEAWDGVEYEAAAEEYNCECIKCGYRMTSDKHCNELKCPKCGGQMRRVERPGSGQEKSANRGALLTRFATRVVNTPLMIAPDKLNAIINVIGSRIGLDVDDNSVDVEISSREAKKDESGIAIIPIYDTLVNRAGGISALSGLTTYEEIGKRFQAALADPKVKKIVLDIDSPGGEVSGVFDLVDEIYNARGVKPIIAAVNDIAYSAAYAIASAADKIYVPRTGGTGSIGVIAVHTDQSEYDKKAGMKYTAIYAGARKNDLSPHEEISAEALGDVQSKVDAVYDLFVKTVARNRNINPDDVKATEAGIFLGEEGLEVGLVDQILSWNQVMKTITTNKGGANMSFKEQLDALLADASVEEIAEGFSQLGYVSKNDLLDVEAIKAEAREEALKEYREQYAGDEGAVQEVADLRKEVEVLKGEVAESKKEAEAEKDARRHLELTQEVKDIGVVGDIEENVNILFSVEKMNPDLAKRLMDQLKRNSEALSASGFFGEIGSSGRTPSNASATAFDELKAKAEALMKEGVEPSKAWVRAARENPELYKSYLEGRT